MFCDIDNSPFWRLQRQWMKAYGCSRCYTATWAKLWDLWEAYHPMTRVVGENMGWMVHGFMGWWCLIGWFFEWRKNLGWFYIFLSHETFIKCGLLYLMNYMEPRRTMYVGYIIIFGVVHPFLRSNLLIELTQGQRFLHVTMLRCSWQFSNSVPLHGSEADTRKTWQWKFHVRYTICTCIVYAFLIIFRWFASPNAIIFMNWSAPSTLLNG